MQISIHRGRVSIPLIHRHLSFPFLLLQSYPDLALETKAEAKVKPVYT